MKRALWIIEIDGEYFVKFKTTVLGRWTKNLELATRFPTRVALAYVRNWKAWGARKVKAS